MATIGQLGIAVAKSLRVEETTVTVFLRYLRDAGLIRKGGRGRGAAKMTPLDAARSIIAFLTVDRSEPRNAVIAVERVGTHVCEVTEVEPKDAIDPLDFGKFLKLKQGHTFEAAISALISALMNDEQRKIISGLSFGVDELKMLPVLKIAYDDGFDVAAIVLNKTTYLYSVSSKAYRKRENSGELRAALIRPSPGGLRTERHIFWPELIPIVECLMGILEEEAGREE